ncbi:hypothetical protein C7Y68_02015 [Paracidovorax avenae]|uniref:hypothetical protein n=1 Tax=Paracidovorax avenae TaxID=80867 RepID=UPI000D168CAF|nr:hypothetical protein [Paracidovorax avenae]AVT04764.1 hypothetical protein C8248_01305 [Paracidovorax avenae]AVT18908.1 hypothetical protein C7Y68_02015 [Paracidovorax avenae]
MLLHRIFQDEEGADAGAVCSGARRARPAVPGVVLPVRLAREPALRVRQRLHAALGPLLGTYRLSVDAVRPVCTVYLHLREADIGECMDRLMAALPMAEFGRIGCVAHDGPRPAKTPTPEALRVHA